MAEASGGGAFAVPDVNVLVALTNPSHQHHEQAHRWFSQQVRFATTPITEAGLVRLLLNPAVTGQAVTGSQAMRILAAVRSHERAVFLPDDSSLAAASVDLIGLAGHQQATDFHLVNLVASHSGQLVTFDRRIRTSLTPEDRGFVRLL